MDRESKLVVVGGGGRDSVSFSYTQMRLNAKKKNNPKL